MHGAEITMAELQEYLLERRESAPIAAREFRQWAGERVRKQKEQP